MRIYSALVGATIILFGVFLFAGTANAISGACSWHGGVNCAAGPDSFGNAICNDGFESSESFSSMSECRQSLSSLCTPPLILGNTEMEMCDRYQGLCDKSKVSREISCARSGIGCNIENTCPDADRCRREVLAFNERQATYNQCVESVMGALKSETKRVEMEIEQKINTLNDISCQSKNGQFSHYNSIKNRCLCDESYAQTKNGCIKADVVCENRLGEKSNVIWAKDKDGEDVFVCECMSGYILNASGRCELKPNTPVKISERALKVANSLLLFCENPTLGLSEQEISECRFYRLNSYKAREYTWEVYNTDTITKIEPQKIEETKPVLPVKKDEGAKVKVGEVSKPTVKSSIIQISTTTPLTLEMNKITTKNQPSFFAKIKNLLLSIWR